MSDKDLIPLENVQLPEYLRGFESELSSSMVTQAESWPRISIKGKQFRLKKDGEEKVLKMGAPLEIIILLADPVKGCAKSYYIEAYDKDSADAPDCSSSDGIVPDSFADDAQSQTCATCPHSEWGSAVDSNGNNTKGKACADVKHLYVVHHATPGGFVFKLQVPPTSLKALSTYGRQLAKHSIPVEGVVTTIQFDDSEHPRLTFNFKAFLPEAQAKIAVERSKSDEILSISNQSAPALAAPVPEQSQTDAERLADLEDSNEMADNSHIEAKIPASQGGTMVDSGFDGFGDAATGLNATAGELDPDLTVALSPAEVKRAKLMAELAALDGDGGDGQYPIGGTIQPELDKAGIAWDPELHAANKAQTGKGMWAKLRGAGKKVESAPKTKEPEQQGGFFGEAETKAPPAGENPGLDAVLDDWAD